MDEVSRVSEMIDFGLYLKTKAVEGKLRAPEGVKWTDLVIVGYGPDQTSGWTGSMEIHAVRTPRMNHRLYRYGHSRLHADDNT